MPDITTLPLPSILPHLDAIRSWKQTTTDYESDCWEFQYEIHRYLGRVDDEALRARYDNIVRNMHAIISEDRNVIPIHSFLSSWYWYRKEHQTRYEFALRKLQLHRSLPLIAKRDLTAARARPRSPNAGDILFRYGERKWLQGLMDFGRLRMRSAEQYALMEKDPARHDDERVKHSYSPGQYVTLTMPDGQVLRPVSDLKYSTSGADYFLYCVAMDWDPHLFDEFSGTDCCVVIKAEASHLHAFTFWSTFSVIRFADFLYSKRRRYLVEASTTPIFYILFVYRGPLLMCFTSWCFVWMIWKGRELSLRRMLMVGCAGLGILYLNGVLGDIRSPGQELAGRPSAAFRESGIPSTFFWAYLYLTAPMANLQLTIDTASTGHGSVPEFLASELLPDFLAKRILPRMNPQIASITGNLTARDLLYSWDQPQISEGLNIATLFARSYSYFGWMGPSLMFLILSAFILGYLILTRESVYKVPCLALLNTLVVFCLFNNMLASTAMILQLAWPLLLPSWQSQRQVQ